MICGINEATFSGAIGQITSMAVHDALT